MSNKKYICSVDIMDVRVKLASGRFATKVNMFGTVLLEDTQTCEAIKLMQLPEGYSFHEKGEWEPILIHTYNGIDNYMEAKEGYACYKCGHTAYEKHDWCVCGADMRESKKLSRDFKEFVESL